MTPLGWWLALAVVVGVTATVRAVWRDHQRAVRAELENRRLTRLVATVREERDEAQDRARGWMAEAESLAADLANHEHRCLGVLVHENDGVLP